ncbi:hypothetical protein FQ017_13015 [Flagellimonas pelagia]|uniref:Aerotolerance regulator N-terminal domain-containing protein n=1 Tax=Flagellimonas pelagia TaxID=2306998 RepID=A0A3A1NHM3_9FLAO|nr:hypothetical protein D2V05_13145 [Allomuricauda maritima]TXJ92702.1 hypothetical protein FQ017_13015 [Allomuricauda maritima]
MIDGLTLLNSKFLWPIVLGLVVLWTIFIWKEWSQRRERRFWIKIILAFIGLSCLALIILKPALPKEQAKGRGVVLTEGFRLTQLDSLKSKYKRIPVEQYIPGKVLMVTDEADSLFLLGSGVQPFDFWQLQGESITFLGADETKGWSEIQHDSHINLGDGFQVMAKYVQPKKNHWAVLLDNGGNSLDSVLFEDDPYTEVTLGTRPKAGGRFEYALVEKDSSGAMVSVEPLPVEIEEREPLKVLIVNDFPTFETKYLKNYLAEMGHQVSVRSQLTKNKYKFEYFNGAANPIYQFTQKALEELDLLIIDADSYDNLNNSSRSALEKSIKDDGLGVFVQPNASFFKRSKNAFLEFVPDYSEKVSFDGPSHALEKYPYAFQGSFPAQSILMDSVSIASYLVKGKGKIATTVLKNSYQLILEGDQEYYAFLWSKILNGIVRKSEMPAEWESITEIPKPDKPFHFKLRTGLPTPYVKSDEAAISLIQNLEISTVWQGTTYPRNPGWNQLQIQKDSAADFHYYVYDDFQRKTVSEKQTREANLREFGMGKSVEESKITSTQTLEPIPPTWFFVLFLLCMGWLWLEPKLSA